MTLPISAGADYDYGVETREGGEEPSSIVALDAQGQPAYSVTATSTLFTLSVAGENGQLEPVLEAPIDVNGNMDPMPLLSKLESLFAEMALTDLAFFEGLVKGYSEAVKKENNEHLSKLSESLEKQQDAKKGGVFGKIFSWVAVAVTVVAAVAASVVTFGAAAPASAMAIVGVLGLVAGSGLMLTYQISTETGGWMQEGLTKMFGGNEMAGMIFFLVLTTVLTMGGAGAGARGLSVAVDAAAAKLVAASEQAVASGVKGATVLSKTEATALAAKELVTENAATAMQYISRATSLVQILSAGSNVYVGVLNYKRDMAAADVAEAQALLDKIRALFAVIRESLNVVIKEALGLVNGVGEIKKSQLQLILAMLDDRRA